MEIEIPAIHPAVAVRAPREPLILIDAPTYPPDAGEVIVKVEWTSSTPYHLHQADGGLLIDMFPRILGDTFAGTVLMVGPGPHHVNLEVGDKVLGYSFRDVKDGKEKAAQTLITVPTYLLGKMPQGLTMQEAVTVPDNIVTVFQAAVMDLGLPLPWPIPEGWTPPEADAPILLWGGAGSVGMYSIEVFRHWGYKNLVVVSSKKHHEYLKSLGATVCFDYRDKHVVDEIREYLGPQGVPYVIDCIGHLTGSLRHITKLADNGTKVAVMLPVVISDPTEIQAPVYQMTEPAEGQWKEGVIVKGVRTHFYLKNQFFKDKMQCEIIPTLLEQKVVRPNPQRIVEGETLLERAQDAIVLLRNKALRVHITMASSMLAITALNYTDPSGYQLSTIPQPVISDPTDVLFRVHAASINPVDVKKAAGIFKLAVKESFPYQIGYDCAGVVTQVGKDVKGIKVGDEVFSRLPEASRGAWSEYAKCPERYVALKPKNLSFEDAASLPLAGMTALQTLSRYQGSLAGKTVFVPAGLSGTGAYACQLAKKVFNAGKVITTVSTSKVDQVPKLLEEGTVDQASI
ncbi:2-methylene-furan-3-one reductase [Colletotrichum sp. SAR 10_96]|nr:2-methylene-furan-3-one reductase [Colletotrichum sp. SAR 10_96]